MDTAPFTGLPFLKMHGLGNDFVIVDLRHFPRPITPEMVRRIADRRVGLGCDQFITIEPSRSPDAEATMGIVNADGEIVESCGNASRCVGWLLMGASGADEAVIDTDGGIVTATMAGDMLVTVDMGPARTDWDQIPLDHMEDTLHLPVSEGDLREPVGVSMGNPHAVFFVDDAEAVPLEAVGPKIEHHELFPERTNVEAAQVLDAATIRMRVWERGVGITMACGTGACATAVAAARRGLTGRQVTVKLDGGDLLIDWRDDNHVMMTGPVAMVAHGVIDESLLV